MSKGDGFVTFRHPAAERLDVGDIHGCKRIAALDIRGIVRGIKDLRALRGSVSPGRIHFAGEGAYVAFLYALGARPRDATKAQKTKARQLARHVVA